jgi:predicted RNA-binding Zn-ribbon protein involved in translation (DUF1610 family)
MKTACPACGAEIVRRTWVRDDPPLFVEVYRCGAAIACGVVTTGLPPIYPCEQPKEENP